MALRSPVMRLLGSWAPQQFLAWWGPVLALDPVFGTPEVTGSPFGNVGIQVFHALAIGALGCFLGFSLGLMFPAAKTSGRWIWVLPVGLLIFSAACDVRTFGWQIIPGEFFYWAHPGRDEAPILREFLAYPALSSVCYSLAMVFGGRILRVARS